MTTGNDLGDELRLVTLVDEHALLWKLNTDQWPAIACRAAGRNMTAEEWEQFGPSDTAYRATCPEWAARE